MRLVSILEEQMISDSVVELIVLVKNCHDADTSLVTVMLDRLPDLATTCITVTDDGFGMCATDMVNSYPRQTSLRKIFLSLPLSAVRYHESIIGK